MNEQKITELTEQIEALGHRIESIDEKTAEDRKLYRKLYQQWEELQTQRFWLYEEERQAARAQKAAQAPAPKPRERVYYQRRRGL